MRYAFTFVAAMLGLAFISASGAPAAEEKAKPQVMEGWIHSVDLNAKSFVLGGKNESQTTFRVAVKVEGNREAAHLLLDGQKATFEAAIQPKRKASVTFVKVADDDLWVWKVEVTSPAGAPAAEEKAKPQVVEGWIHSVDLNAKSFVLGGKNESQTTFRVAVKVEGKREAAHVLLDGQKATFEAAIQPKRKASVTYVKVADDDLWVWKVEVTSPPK